MESMESIPSKEDSKSDVEEPSRRERWGSRTEFVLATVGNCVGVGNVWRFPYLCYKNGGGTFLIPYFLALALVGTPIFMLELAVGQRFGKGNAHSYQKLHKRLIGVGVASTCMAYVTLWYYNIIVAWTIVYMAHSLRSPNRTPWGPKTVDSERFWDHAVLWESDGFEEFRGVTSFQLVLGSVFAWIALFFTTKNGVKSTGKVAYVTATLPYLLLAMLVLRGVTLKGAGEGLRFYLKPQFSKLFESPDPWLDAANQIIYSLGVGTGQLVAFGSYNPKDEDVVFDSVAIAGLNSFTSLFAGIAIFSIIGHKAQRDGEKVADVVDSGEGLAFVAYPDGLSTLPGAGVWCFIFFGMLFFLAIDSSMAMLEAWMTLLADFGLFKPDSSKDLDDDVVDEGKRAKGVFFSCLFGFCVSFIFITRPGIYWFTLVDSFVVWGVFAVAALECWGVARLYGAENFAKDIYDMTRRKVPQLIITCWTHVTPSLCVILGLVSFVVAMADTHPEYEGANATSSARVVGIFLMLIPVVIMALGATFPDADFLYYFRETTKASSSGGGALARGGGALALVVKAPFNGGVKDVELVSRNRGNTDGDASSLLSDGSNDSASPEANLV